MTSLGIERLQYVALGAEDPEAAAAFATEKMGLSLAHVGADGSHYLKAHGPDQYSLVYKSREFGIDHLGFLVRSAEQLDAARKSLEAAGLAVEAFDGDEWEQGQAIQVASPAGHTYRLTTGLHFDLPVAAQAVVGGGAPEPIACDHAVARVVDFEADSKFAQEVLGLRRSARIETPDKHPIMEFFRAGVIFHNLGLAQSESNGLHHYQFTLKSPEAFYAAQNAMEAAGVDIMWGPLRHGPGHNIAMYFRDAAGYFVEYSVEEEIILHDETYEPRSWSVTDPKAMDEWATGAPPDALLKQ